MQVIEGERVGVELGEWDLGVSGHFGGGWRGFGGNGLFCVGVGAFLGGMTGCGSSLGGIRSRS